MCLEFDRLLCDSKFPVSALMCVRENVPFEQLSCFENLAQQQVVCSELTFRQQPFTLHTVKT